MVQEFRFQRPSSVSQCCLNTVTAKKCPAYIRVEALYTLKHHPAESVTSDFFIADPRPGHDTALCALIRT